MSPTSLIEARIVRYRLILSCGSLHLPDRQNVRQRNLHAPHLKTNSHVAHNLCDLCFQLSTFNFSLTPPLFAAH